MAAHVWRGAGTGSVKTDGHSGQDDSSESDGETEPARAFHRRISTNKEIKSATDQKITSWVMKQREQQLPVSQQSLQSYSKSLVADENPDFKASKGWLQKFMKRNNLSTRRKTTMAQKMPADLLWRIDVFRNYLKEVREQKEFDQEMIVNMDEVPMYFDFVPRQTIHRKGDRDVPIITTGGEKRHFTAVLAVAASGAKLPPMIIFKGKRPLNLTVPDGWIVTVNPTAWMTEDLMKIWLTDILKPYTQRRPTLLVMDSFAAHTTEAVDALCEKINCTKAVIPGGCTSKVQPLDVCLNKPFKDSLRRSWSAHINEKACIKDGYLMKQTSSFQRWRRRYFKLKGRKLYYAKNHTSEIFNEIELTDLSLAECSTKNINHSFQVITPFRNLVLCAESRREMEEWISALKSASNREYYDPTSDHKEMMSGQHNWYACSHARPSYCNVCREALSGVTSHGLSCEVCKFKAHKRCAVRATNTCKWTTLASIGKDIIENEDGITMPHQWLEGNLPVSAKCVVCDKTCGSVLRLQDYRCLWCRAMVHSSCKEQFPKQCPLGQCRISVLPPTAVNSMDSDGYWEASRPPGSSPLLVFVNTKSGDNQGVKFLRRFKQLLNPAQIFDLMNGGPHAGLRLFQKFDPFRILVCGGDGSIGWVLSEIDTLNLHKQCQVGVLPFGTGNDLARVLGWGGAIDDDTQLPTILEKLEHSQIKMLDRWSIKTYEGTMPPPRKLSQQFDPISVYEDSVAAHLTKILHSDDHSTVISSAKVLCETVKNFVAKVGEDQEKESEESISQKCAILNEKLKNLLSTLNEESKASQEPEEIQPVEEEVIVGSPPDRDTVPGEITGPIRKTRLGTFKSKNALMCRANSLKKAVRQIIEHTEKAVDEQNAQTEQHRLELEQRLHGTQDDNDNRNIGLQAASHTSRSAPSFMGLDDPPRQPTVTFREPEGCRSPKGPTSRRISSMSTFNKSASVGSNLSRQGRDKSPSSAPESIPAEQPPPSIPFLGLGVQGLSAFPSLSSSIAGRLAGGSFISKVLLANADALCAAASPLIHEDIPISEYEEKCVMNNYFGIGLDAKITLDFNNKREEHPEKCRSRTKNFMWYSVIGGKEILQRTFRNLDQRVQLECDGQRIPLPSLQGIVILNIPSYAGGSNFWGGRKEHDNFTAPSFDDKVLEIVAVFGGVQMAMSRVLEFQHHRIAQCRTLKITIMGDEGVPVQVDGEAWIQPPGYIRIEHRNRAQMLTRDRTFENVLKSWSEKQKIDRPITIQTQTLNEDEAAVLQNFIEVATVLIKSVKVAALSHSTVEQELFPLATHASDCLDRLYPSGRLLEPTPRSQVIEFIHSVKALYNDTGMFLADKATALPINPEVQDKLNSALAQTEVELRKVMDIAGVLQAQHFMPIPQHTDHEAAYVDHHKHHKKGKLNKVFGKIKGRNKDKERDYGNVPQVYNVHHWTSEEVGLWLESLGLSEYKYSFESHDIRGSELLALERRDLKDLGVSKVGHLKRIQHGIKDLLSRSAAYERTSCST